MDRRNFHHRRVRDRSRSGRRIVKAEDPHGQTEFGRQFLDRAGTPTGQHRLQITSPRLHGDKMPRIAVGAVNLHIHSMRPDIVISVVLLSGLTDAVRRHVGVGRATQQSGTHGS